MTTNNQMSLSCSTVDKITKVVNQICTQYKLPDETCMLLEIAAFRSVGIILKENKEKYDY